MDGEKIAQILETKIYSKYDVSKIELNVTNSDGVSWIKRPVLKKWNMNLGTPCATRV